MKKTYSITLFRHGQTNYLQGNELQTVSSANDLTPEAVDQIRQSAEVLAHSLDDTIPVTILSSPVGRTLHTAKVIMEVLVQHGFGVNAIQSDPLLWEVANFSWNMFEPLMNGGVMNYPRSHWEPWFEVNRKNLLLPNCLLVDYAALESLQRRNSKS